ncbi:MAG: hypothetical protein QOK02_1284 [Mycobacterium sp.]|jgi:hypothetical protein|nr:hypothetical protein [Mycobacterium sp.]
MNEVIAGVEIPDTALVREATELVRGATDDALFNHCRRVYLWGSLLGRHAGLEVDPQLFYVATMFHDLGVTKTYGRTEHFEIDGANAAWDFLLSNGFASVKAAKNVWQAIALHTGPGAAEHADPEIALLSAGIQTDTRGRDLDVLTSDEIHRVIAAHPDCAASGHCSDTAHRRNIMAALMLTTAIVATVGCSVLDSAGVATTATLDGSNTSGVSEGLASRRL